MTEDEADDYAAWKTGCSLAHARADRQMQAQQRDLQTALDPIAKKLGLRIKVQHDAYNFGWHVGGALITPRADFTIDEEMLFIAKKKHLIDLLMHEMEGLQYRVFKQAATFLGEHDVCGRKYLLDKDDQSTLHDMYCDAEEHTYSRFVYADAKQPDRDEEKRRRYQALIGKLFA